MACHGPKLVRFRSCLTQQAANDNNNNTETNQTIATIEVVAAGN
jgi:hypothetical protein